MNPYEVIAWNTEHRFLDELYARGVSVVPSVLVPQHEQPDAVLAAMEQRGWTEALVLPAILPEEVMQVYVAAAPAHSPLASTTTTAAAVAADAALAPHICPHQQLHHLFHPITFQQCSQGKSESVVQKRCISVFPKGR